MTGLVTGILLLAGAVLLLGLAVSIRAGRRSRGAREAQPPRPVPFRPPAPEECLPFARPGLRGRLFHYGGDGPGFEVDAPYAVVHVETTGFSPANGDRIVEIAIVRVDARGRIEDEYATVLDPGRDVGPVFVHGISTSEVRDAPCFRDVAGELLARLDGTVVVAHNAVVVERFLAAEFDQAGIAVPIGPAVCSLWLARRTLRNPSARLTTLARSAGLPAVGGHSALGAARTVAALLPRMLAAHGEPLRFLTGVRPMPDLPSEEPRTRVADLGGGSSGWIRTLLTRLPASVALAAEPDAQRYVDVLLDAVEDGRLLGGEAQQLTRLAGSAGLGAPQVADLHGRLLGVLRSAALAAGILTTAEIRQLRTTAAALGMPDFFADLRSTSPADLATRSVAPAQREMAGRQRA